MAELVVLRYQLIDELRGDDNDELRTSPAQFRDHMFWLMQNNYQSISLNSFNECTKNNDRFRECNEKYFLVVIEGNYYANGQALNFLRELNIDTVVCRFDNFTDLGAEPSKMTHYHGLPLMDINEFQKCINPDNGHTSVIDGSLPKTGKNLIATSDLYQLVKETESNRKIFSCFHENGYNNAIIKLLSRKGYQFLITHDSGHNSSSEFNPYKIKSNKITEHTTSDDIEKLFDISTEEVHSGNFKFIDDLFKSFRSHTN